MHGAARKGISVASDPCTHVPSIWGLKAGGYHFFCKIPFAPRKVSVPGSPRKAIVLDCFLLTSAWVALLDWGLKLWAGNHQYSKWRCWLDPFQTEIDTMYVIFLHVNYVSSIYICCQFMKAGRKNSRMETTTYKLLWWNLTNASLIQLPKTVALSFLHARLCTTSWLP